MPVYEYQCNDCDKVFSLRLHIEEHEKARPQCPDCGSDNLSQRFGTFFAKTAKKS